jgi:transcriptional regulator with XRE-family HTH domain
MNNFSSSILRAVRKFYRLNQSDFAPILSITQSALSKIEAGQLELSALQWLAVCDKFTLDPRSIFTGKIENLGDRKLKVESLDRVGGFRLPDQYSYLMGSSVRTAYPLLKFMRLRLGEQRFDAFIKSTGFDKDYFVIMNNPLNLKFIEHMVLFLLAEGGLSLDHVGSIIELGQFKDIHSTLIPDFGQTQNLETATKKLLTKVKATYEQNTIYEFLGEKEFIHAKDQDFLKEFKLSSEFNEFRRRFNLSHFIALDDYVTNGEHKFKVKSTQDGWLILKAS